jgi:hypothetical protein
LEIRKSGAETKGRNGTKLQKGGDGGDEAVPRGFEGLREDAGLAENGHEVVVTGPTRDEVAVEVGDAAAGGGAEVEADVNPVGFEDGFKELLAEDDFFHEIGAFGGGELEEVVDLAEGDGEQVAGIVGKAVENEVGKWGPVDDEGSAVIAKDGQFGERSLEGGGIARCFDVFHAPVRVELLRIQRIVNQARRRGDVKAVGREIL